jgi:tetratricopeptide (TPR) repeat protein/predicted Ser/Thr protein kinase
VSPLPPSLLELATTRLLAACSQERRAVCEELARQHPDLRDALQRLLRRIDGAERLLDRSFPAPPPDEDPAELGGYRVLRRLGEGAFGSVYLCEQTQPIARRVAVKVLRPGAGDRNTLARFAAERQVLASLAHPAITPIHDAGHLPDGRPFFVMEFVDGLPFAAYCRTRALALEDTLRLFVRLCHGVEHAHQRGVVHRDLKPANVLVVDSEGAPQPKIIDFGIAKALAAEPGAGDGSAPATDAGRVLGTPGYMSPEQAAGRADRVDARADVFALGVMLYEVLAGELPWSRRGVGADDPTTEPPLPSQRLAAAGSRAADGTAARRAAARVRGDLDWITAKAMRREPGARYPTARELAEDLERHLAHRPVLAGPPTIGYRARRFVRRHRVAALALVGATLVAGAFVLAGWRERGVARAAIAEAQAAADRLLATANSDAVLGAPQHDPVRQALASEALAAYERRLAERPDDRDLRTSRARALLTLADVHAVLGEADRAGDRAAEAANEADALLAADATDDRARGLAALALQQQVRVLHLRRDHAGSLPLCERAVDALAACAARDAAVVPAFAKALVEHAHALSALGRHEPSLAALTRAVDALQALPPAGRSGAVSDLVLARANRAAALMQLRRFDEADAELAECAAQLPALVQGRERTLALVLGQQAEVAARRGDHAVAANRWQRAIEAGEALVAREPRHLRGRYMLFEACRRCADAHEARGDWPAADAAAARAVDVGEAWLATFPDDGNAVRELRERLYAFAHARWSRFRRGDLRFAVAWLARCEQLAERARAAAAHPSPPGWVLRTLQAQVAEADGAPGLWEELAADLPGERPLADGERAYTAAEAWLGVVRARLRRADLAAAGDALAHAVRFAAASNNANLRSEAAWWRARVAVAAQRWDDVDAAIDDVVAARGSWWGHWRAGTAAHDAWRALVAAGAVERAALARDRAAGHHRAVIAALRERVAANAGDPWLVVPWAGAGILLAAADADRGDRAAASALTAALAALPAVEAEAHRDLWDDARIAHGRALAVELGATR